MKYILIFLAFLLTSCMDKSNNPSFYLEGHLEYHNQSIPVHQLNLDLITFNAVDTIKTDSNGYFNLTIDAKETGIAFIRLPNGSPMDVFIEPNREVQVSQKDGIIEYSESSRIYQFMKEMYNEYYKKQTEIIGDSEVTEFYDSLLNSQMSKLNSLKENTSKELYFYIKHTMLGLNYSKRINYLSKIDTIPATSNSYSFLDEIIFTDEKVLLAKEYVNMQIQALPSLLARQGNEPSVDSAYVYLDKIIQSDRYRKYAQSIFLLFNYSVLSKSSRENILNEFKIKYEGHIPLPVQGMIQLMPGEKMIDFELKQNNGTVKLSEFKDKMVLIDFWATWCGPCVKEEPFIYEIASSNMSEIVVLSINLDESKEKWLEHLKDLNELANIKQFKLEGGFSSKLTQQLFLVGIPRYILLEKNNIIIDAYAPVPSSKEMKNLIQKYK